jgi:AraC-like DNA-binding protein
MNDRPQNITAQPERAIHARAGIGAAAHVLQHRELAILRVHVAQNALIRVVQGVKTIHTAHGAPVQASPGQAIFVAANQSVDFLNAVPHGGRYEARWLLFDDNLLADDGLREHGARRRTPAMAPDRQAGAVPLFHPELAGAMTRAAEALDPAGGVPEPVARLRMLETLFWLGDQGIVLQPSPRAQTVSASVRALASADLDRAWTGAAISSRLAMSEATLRRRLADEGTSLTTLLADVRMASALTLLQATNLPVAAIALAVGYASSSRFAVRFRHRFGFPPGAVRTGACNHNFQHMIGTP